MSLSDYLDTERLADPMYWLLTGGAEVALLIGFKAQGLWATDIGMSIWSKLLTLALVPIASYFIVGAVKR